MKGTHFSTCFVRTGTLVAVIALLSVSSFAPRAHAADADLSLQLQALLKQVAMLQAQISAGSSVSASAPTGPAVSSVSCMPPTVVRNLAMGSTGNDVSALQTFLARDASIYPEASVTGYFGPATAAAVGRFQVRHAVLPNGSTAVNGLGAIGPRTRAVLMNSCTSAVANTGVPGSTSTSVSTGSNAGTNSGSTSSNTTGSNSSGSVSGSSNASVNASTSSIDSLLKEIQSDLKNS